MPVGCLIQFGWTLGKVGTYPERMSAFCRVVLVVEPKTCFQGWIALESFSKKTSSLNRPKCSPNDGLSRRRAPHEFSNDEDRLRMDYRWPSMKIRLCHAVHPPLVFLSRFENRTEYMYITRTTVTTVHDCTMSPSPDVLLSRIDPKRAHILLCYRG